MSGAVMPRRQNWVEKLRVSTASSLPPMVYIIYVYTRGRVHWFTRAEFSVVYFSSKKNKKKLKIIKGENMQRWHQLAKVGVLIDFSGFEFRSSARLRAAEGGAGPEFFFAMGEGGKFPQVGEGGSSPWAKWKYPVWQIYIRKYAWNKIRNTSLSQQQFGLPRASAVCTRARCARWNFEPVR